jgi:trk system potassium uptake protein
MLKFKFIHFRLILRFLGMAFLVISGLQILSLGIAVVFSEPEWKAFALSAAISAGVGLLLFALNPVSQSEKISIRDSFLIIILIWFFVPAAGMLPFYLGTPITSVLDAFFESYAGFTTTGFTNLAKYELLPKSIIFWKSITQWIGGMGLMVFIIALFPFIREGEFKVFFSDIQDTSYKPLHNRITANARRLWYIYLSFTVLGMGALILAGQDWFDALCFSLSSISTGGGVPYNGNLTNFSIPVKSVLMVIMLIAGANYFFIFQVFKRQSTFRSDEFVAYLKIIFFASFFIVSAQIVVNGFSPLGVFEGVFNTISIVSTTGFYTNEMFDHRILFVWISLFFLLFIGSSTGSSGGGINIYRVLIMFRSLKNFVKTSIHPNSYFQTTFNRVPVKPAIINRVYAFFVLYIVIFFLGAMMLSYFGFSFENAIGFCAASLSNTGPGVFLINGYSELSQIHSVSKITMIILMVIGRIELFPFLIIISRSFWKA